MFTSHSSNYKFSPIWDWKEPSWYNLQLINPWNVNRREWNGGGNNCIMRGIKALSILKFALLHCCTGHKNVPKVWIKIIGMPWWSNLHTQLAQKLSTRKEKYGHEEKLTYQESEDSYFYSMLKGRDESDGADEDSAKSCHQKKKLKYGQAGIYWKGHYVLYPLPLQSNLFWEHFYSDRWHGIVRILQTKGKERWVVQCSSAMPKFSRNSLSTKLKNLPQPNCW